MDLKKIVWKLKREVIALNKQLMSHIEQAHNNRDQRRLQ